MERLREEKDQEIEILQAGMDSTIEQLTEAQQVKPPSIAGFATTDHTVTESRTGGRDYRCPNRHPYPGQPQEAEPNHRSVIFPAVRYAI